MRKILLLFFLIVFCKQMVFSQTVYWTENFNSNEGWTLEQNWNISSGKLEFYWSPSINNFDLSAISPTIELLENVQDLIVKQHLNVFGSSNPPEAAEIYLVTSTSEYLLWSHLHNQGNWGAPSGTEIDFDISSFGGQEVQFKFRTHGLSTYQWNWWNIFSLKLTATLENDLAVTSLDGPNIISPGFTSTWTVEVKNVGQLPQSDFTVSLNCMKNGLVGSVDITETIVPQQTILIDFDWAPTHTFNTAFYAEVELEGDDFTGNNTSRSHFVRVKPDMLLSVLVWDNDNGISTITCPDQGDVVRPTVVLTRALDNAGIGYDQMNSLPPDLNEYNIIFVSLGGYCLS